MARKAKEPTVPKNPQFKASVDEEQYLLLDRALAKTKRRHQDYVREAVMRQINEDLGLASQQPAAGASGGRRSTHDPEWTAKVLAAFFRELETGGAVEK